MKKTKSINLIPRNGNSCKQTEYNNFVQQLKTMTLDE